MTTGYLRTFHIVQDTSEYFKVLQDISKYLGYSAYKILYILQNTSRYFGIVQNISVYFRIFYVLLDASYKSYKYKYNII